MQPVLNVVTVLIFLGVVQGLFLSVFFLLRRSRATLSDRYLGLLLLALAMISLEMMLGYSGYITRALYLVDFSEPVNFTVGPLLYLLVVSRLAPEPRWRPRTLMHFVPFAFYLLYHLSFMSQGDDFKELAWFQAWRAPDFDADGPLTTTDVDPWELRAHLIELTVLHASVYITAAAAALIRANRQGGARWWGGASEDIVWARNLLLQFVGLVLAVVAVKLSFPNDLGDYILAILITLIIYATTVSVLMRSSFSGSSNRKYLRSAMTAKDGDAVLKRLDTLMATEKPHLQPSVTLAKLAALVHVTPHQLSQALNESGGCTFHEYLARRRIEEATRLLSSPEKDRLRIEDVAERVGYYSKSSFNTAFRRITGLTPSQFRDAPTI